MKISPLLTSPFIVHHSKFPLSPPVTIGSGNVTHAPTALSGPTCPWQSTENENGHDRQTTLFPSHGITFSRTLKLSDFVLEEAKSGTQLTSTLYSPPLLSVSSYP